MASKLNIARSCCDLWRTYMIAADYQSCKLSSEWGNTFGTQSAALLLCRETFEVVTNFSRVLSNLLNFAHREEQDKCWEVFVEAATKVFWSTDKFLSFSELLYNLFNIDLNETFGSLVERKININQSVRPYTSRRERRKRCLQITPTDQFWSFSCILSWHLPPVKILGAEQSRF